jgi:lycopene cyclase domain-containing protein
MNEDHASARRVRVPEYTVLTGCAVVAVVLAELLYFKSGIFTTAQYWWSIVIVFAFQIPVDGWLTKLSNPIVIYDPEEMLGWRTPWDIPVEDFGFGFAMVTLAILLWRRWLDRRPSSQEANDGDYDHDARRRSRLRRGRTSL